MAELRRHLAQEPLALLIADVALAKELAALDVPCLWLVENAGIAQTLLASAQFNFRDLLVEPLTPDDLLIALHAALVRRQ